MGNNRGDFPIHIVYNFSLFLVQWFSSLMTWTDLIQIWNLQACPSLHCVTCTWAQYAILWNIIICKFTLSVHASWWHNTKNSVSLFYQSTKDMSFHPIVLKLWYGIYISIFFCSIKSYPTHKYCLLNPITSLPNPQSTL